MSKESKTEISNRNYFKTFDSKLLDELKKLPRQPTSLRSAIPVIRVAVAKAILEEIDRFGGHYASELEKKWVR